MTRREISGTREVSKSDPCTPKRRTGACSPRAPEWRCAPTWHSRRRAISGLFRPKTYFFGTLFLPLVHARVLKQPTLQIRERVYVPAAAAAVRTACLALAPGSRVGTPPERASTLTLGAIASFADAAASASLPAGAPTKTERNAGFSGGED